MALGINIEKIKQEGLEVDIDRLSREGFYAIPKDDFYRLKMHGICSQRHEGFFMLRHRIGGGRLTPDQMETLCDLAAQYASGYIHLTSRQNVELHSITIEKVPAILGKLDQAGLSTRSACGHTFRNVIATPCSGTCPTELVDIRPWVAAVSRLVIQTSEYYNPRLPKRLNVSFSGCACGADYALVNDIGLTAVKNAQGEVGFSLHVAGSMGVTPKAGYLLKDFIALKDTFAAIKTVTHLYILYGDRENVAKGRLKFLLEKMGLEKFLEEYEKAFPEFQAKETEPLPLAEPDFVPGPGHTLPTLPPGVKVQRQSGFYRVAVMVPLGEIHHSHFRRYAQWSRQNCFGRVVITKEQNLEFQWVPGDQVQSLLDLSKSLGSTPGLALSILDVQACPGTSFCSLAVTGSQGAAQSLMQYFESANVVENPFLKDLRVHISGCPNGCAQHQGADIGLSGFTVKVGADNRFAYQLYLGGRLEGGVRLANLAKKGIADEMIVPVVDALLTIFRKDKEKGENFPAFLERLTLPEVVNRLDTLLVARGLNPTTYNRVEAEAASIAMTGENQ